MNVHFAFIGEGTSDRRLVPAIEQVLVRAGALSVTGIAPELERLRPAPGHTVQAQAQAAIKLMPTVQLLCVHRDANGAGPERRRHEITQATAGLSVPILPVVPVAMLEAWLLTDAAAIRRAAQRPNGTMPLQIPTHPEEVRDPKALLKALLASASGLSGRRLDHFNQMFPQNRAWLIDNLDLDGPIRRLPSWQRLEHEAAQVLESLA